MAELACQDGHNDQMKENKRLVQKIASSCAGMLAQGGDGSEIHVAHRTKSPYNQWKIKHSIGLSLKFKPWTTGTSNGNGNVNGTKLEFKRCIVLDKCCLPS